MTPRAETLGDQLVRVLNHSVVTKPPTTDDEVLGVVIDLLDRLDEREEAVAIGPVPADAEAGLMVQGSLRRALHLIRRDTRYYGDLAHEWSDERIDRMAAGLAECVGREWFGTD